MKKLILLLILLLISTFSHSAQSYKKVKIYFNDLKEINQLNDAGIFLDHASVTKDKALVTFLSDEEYSRLKTLSLRSEVLIENWYEHYNKRPQLTEAQKQLNILKSKQLKGVSNFSYGSMGGFYTFKEVLAQLDSMRSKFPGLITEKKIIGTTFQGRQVYVCKISKNADADNVKPEALYTALTHAREPEGMMQLVYFMYYLLENYNTDPAVKYIVDNRNLYFIPVVNPDGYENNRVTYPTGGGMWRKNMVTNSDGTKGVDLNRNYGPMQYWNSPNNGSGTNTSDDTYRGSSPFSEKETQIIRYFLYSKRIKICLNYHSYGNDVIYPYGALNKETPDSLLYREFSGMMTKYNHYTCGTDLQTVGYSTRGGSDDYMYDGDTLFIGKIFAMTPEVGGGDDGFWPLQERILPIAMENIFQNMVVARVAGEYVSLTNFKTDKQYFNPGETIKLTPVVKNRGLLQASNLSFRLSSLSPLVTADQNTFTLASLPARASIELNSAFACTVNSTAQPGTIVSLLFSSLIDGVITNQDTISFKIGIPAYSFIDTTNDISKFWTVAVAPSNAPKWEAASSEYHSAPTSYTDSKNGNYTNSSIVIMSLTNPVQLPSDVTTYLSFWTKYDIEKDYDYGIVEVSSDNGSTWEALKGNYTKTGSIGKPVYEGVMSNWVTEEINLSNYKGKPVKIRFKLVTDSYSARDGWYVDDISFYKYSTVPVELTAFNAKASGKEIVLQWITATELNNFGFEVQKAVAENKFFTIGFVKGKGTTAQISEYTLHDTNPLSGRNEYRLRQVDFDGTSRFYNPVEINFSNPAVFSLMQNYPNPFNPETKIEYSIQTSGKVKIAVYDILGNQVAELLNETQPAGNHSVMFSADKYKLASGIYFYKLESGSYSSIRKMSVLK